MSEVDACVKAKTSSLSDLAQHNKAYDIICKNNDQIMLMDILINKLDTVEACCANIKEALKYNDRLTLNGYMNPVVHGYPFLIKKDIYNHTPSTIVCSVTFKPNKFNSYVEIWWAAILTVCHDEQPTMLHERLIVFTKKLMGLVNYEKLITKFKAARDTFQYIECMRCSTYDIKKTNFLHIQDYITNEFIKSTSPAVKQYCEYDSGKCIFIIQLDTPGFLDEHILIVQQVLVIFETQSLDVLKMEAFDVPVSMLPIIKLLIPHNTHNVQSDVKDILINLRRPQQTDMRQSFIDYEEKLKTLISSTDLAYYIGYLS